MTTPAATVSELGCRRAQPGVTRTALRVLERLRDEAGEVAVIVAPRLSAEVLCMGRRDVTLGPNDVLVAMVGECPLYVDGRAYSSAQLSTMVLDALPDLYGMRFVLRSSGGYPS